MANPFKI